MDLDAIGRTGMNITRTCLQNPILQPEVVTTPATCAFASRYCWPTPVFLGQFRVGPSIQERKGDQRYGDERDNGFHNETISGLMSLSDSPVRQVRHLRSTVHLCA